MKKATFLVLAIGSALMLSCTANTFEEIQKPVNVVVEPAPGPVVGKITYNADVKPIIDANCISCHSNGGQSPALVSYTQVKNSGGRVVNAIQGINGVPQMPQSGKMSADKIKTIVDWSTQGFLEK